MGLPAGVVGSALTRKPMAGEEESGETFWLRRVEVARRQENRGVPAETPERMGLLAVPARAGSVGLGVTVARQPSTCSERARPARVAPVNLVDPVAAEEEEEAAAVWWD